MRISFLQHDKFTFNLLFSYTEIFWLNIVQNLHYIQNFQDVFLFVLVERFGSIAIQEKNFLLFLLYCYLYVKRKKYKILARLYSPRMKIIKSINLNLIIYIFCLFFLLMLFSLILCVIKSMIFSFFLFFLLVAMAIVGFALWNNSNSMFCVWVSQPNKSYSDFSQDFILERFFFLLLVSFQRFIKLKFKFRFALKIFLCFQCFIFVMSKFVLFVSPINYIFFSVFCV